MSIDASLILQAAEIQSAHPSRPANSYHRPGGLIDLTDDRRPMLIIGDLHGAHENLAAILAHRDNRRRILNGEIQLIILGDCLHNDQTGEMLEMQSSLIILEMIIELMLEMKDQLIYIRGNHDTFDERLGKSGIKQGLEFKNYLLMHRGEEYLEAVETLFLKLPMLVLTPDSIITHAGPIRNGANRREIIDIEDNADYYHQLMWNRLHEFRGNPNLKEYDERDIVKMRSKLEMPENCYFIVGHNPMWQYGDQSGIWIDIIGIKGHIILYANRATRAPYIMVEERLITPLYAIPKKESSYYV